VLNARDFDEKDFARSHPGGSLGRRLLLYVEDIMRKGDEVPLINEEAKLSDALVEMSGKGLGMTGIVNEANKLVGIYTDGDLRRTLAGKIDVDIPITEVMTNNPITAKPTILAAELVSLMKQKRISGVMITDESGVIGALNMQDLLKAGVL